MHRLALTGLLPVLFAAVTSAQQPPTVAEAEYLSALSETHPAVRDAAEAVALAEADVLASRMLANPVLGAVREDSRGSVQQTDLLISWQLPDVARGARIKALQRELDAARARYEQQLLSHRLSMRETYAKWALAREREGRLLAQSERVESLAVRETARSNKGEASGLEAHRLRLAAAALRSRVALATVESERARGDAAAWHPNLPSDARPDLPDLPDAPSLTGPSTQVLAAETELLAATLARQAAARFVTSPEVSLGWQQQQNEAATIDGLIVGLAWSVPIFDREQAGRNAAEAIFEGARARLELIERQVDASRVAMQKSFASLSSAVHHARRELTLSEAMLDGAEAAFRLGEASLTDLLETHRSVTEAELVMLDLYEEALAIHRELERLAGAANPVPSEPHSAALEAATRRTHHNNPTTNSPAQETNP